MVSVNRRRLWIGATILIVFVVAATAYALRGRLANAPLVGRFVSSHGATAASQNPDQIAYWTLAAVAGGLLGSELGSKRLAGPALRRLMAVVLVIAGLKMIFT